MQKIKREIAKIISSSGDLQGATWEEIKKIDKLVKLFKIYSLTKQKRPNRCSETTYQFIINR